MTEIVEQKIVSGCKNLFRTFYIAVMHYGVWLLIFLRKEQMQMKLVLAEKPSVAQSIAKVLGAAKREDGYLEGNGYVVSWCVGHLVELAQPEVYDAKYSKWAYADLPIFPMDWQYEVSAGTKKQFWILKKLMAREDVASLVCATDAGREGELIFRLVYHKAGCRKPFERLWISSMEDVAIKEGFENLRSGTEYDALYEAALCRERADWIVGMDEYYEHLRADNIEAFSKEKNDEYVGRAEEYKAAKSALLEGLGLEHLFDHSHELTPKEKAIWMLFDRVHVAELLARDAFAKGAYMLGAEDREIMLK